MKLEDLYLNYNTVLLMVQFLIWHTTYERIPPVRPGLLKWGHGGQIGPEDHSCLALYQCQYT